MEASAFKRQRSSTVDSEPQFPPQRGPSRIRKFDGEAGTAQDWDGLRKDDELWDQEGDSLVHFYAPRVSKRGPSLKVPSSIIKNSGSGYLVEQLLRKPNSFILSSGEDGNSDSGYASSDRNDRRESLHGLFVPAPQSLSTEQAFHYHITTRNFFAFLSGRPLVGASLSNAILGLHERVRLWQPQMDAEKALGAILHYAEEQGYLRLAGRRDYALAMLGFAEATRLCDLWMNAFSHCVGMHEDLDLSLEFASISNTTKALITRASLEMDLHISRVCRALGGFLEEELGTEHLGLSRAARNHLDRFRSFLHVYYVDKLGYFPPSETESWDKRMWTSMYHEFQSLYEYLVDSKATEDPWSNWKPAQGGFCVLQNVEAFDKRHGYTPLPHAIPLLPVVEAQKPKTEVQKGLLTFKLSRSESRAAGKAVTSRQALIAATNTLDARVLACPLVQEYQRFERQKLEEKVPLADARKVRWLLIYGVLQMLTSITRAPKEVKDSETPKYPLCVLTTGCPPWEEIESHTRRPSACSTPEKILIPQALDISEDEEKVSIRPDCEAENAEDYFNHTGSLSRRGSQMSLTMVPSPLRTSTTLSRSASIRSSMQISVTSLHRSVVGSLSRKSSARKQQTRKQSSRTNSTFCEIVIEGYGNGMEVEQSPQQALDCLEGGTMADDVEEITPTIDQDFDFGFGMDDNNKPTANVYQLDPPRTITSVREEDEMETPMSPYDSDASLTWSLGSNRSSASLAEDSSPATEISSWDSGSWQKNSEASSTFSMSATLDFSTQSMSALKTSFQQKRLNAGCYTPTGTITPPASRCTMRRKDSSDTVESVVSSLYASDSRQADEIEEEESRGRPRSRGLKRFRPSSVAQAEIYAEAI